MTSNMHFEVEELPSSFFKALREIERGRETGVDASVPVDMETEREKENRPAPGGASFPKGAPAPTGVMSDGNESPSGARARRLPPSLAIIRADSNRADDGLRSSPGVGDGGAIISHIPLAFHRRDVFVADTPARIDALVHRIQRLCAVPGHSRVVGWDIEWVVNFVAGRGERPVALTQIAVRPKPPARPLIALLRLRDVPGGITPTLRAFLEDPTIRKVGVQIRGDAHKMTRDFGVRVGGVSELRDLARAVADSSGHRPASFSLSALTEWTLNRALPKNKGERVSNWEASTLTEEQVMYAALDAWASLLVYENLSERAPQGASGDTQTQTERRTSTNERPRADSGEADGWDPQVVTPALSSERQTALMPAKADAHRLHMELGWSGVEIAESKGVMASTANGYLADAIRAGRAYRLGALGLKKKTLASVMLALDAQRKSSPEVTSAAAVNAALGSERPTIRAVRELMDEEVDYASVSFALAHLERMELLASTRARSSVSS
jgi:hypothetical protein